MKIIEWKNNSELTAGTTLREPNRKEFNNMALHVGGNLIDVVNNRTELSTQLGIQLNQWVFAQQTHSDHIKEVKKEDMGKGATLYEEGIVDCDALYTKDKGVAIGIFHADCVPVLLYDPYTSIVCAIHSGWQGTVKEITRKAVEHLIEKEHVAPEHLIAYIGPSIARNSFEVGEDVIELVKHMSFDTFPFISYQKNDKALIDNKGLNVAMLVNLGVPFEQITVNPNNTFMDNDAFFSYRRKQDCGRHLSYIMMKE